MSILILLNSEKIQKRSALFVFILALLILLQLSQGATMTFFGLMQTIDTVEFEEKQIQVIKVTHLFQ